jgi:drug/metabolite transporter (DMT)-like permease
LILILLSAVLHAFWNFLFKRAGGDEAMLAAGKVVEAIGLLPFGIWFALHQGSPPTRTLVTALIGSALVLANYRLLAAAYRRIDLSIGYPIARGAVLLFLPLFGWLALGEHISMIGMAGLTLIVIGVFMQARSAHGANWPGIAFALAGACSTAVYTVWDKHAVGFLDPVVYFTAYTGITALAYIAVVFRNSPRDMLHAFREKRLVTLGVAAGNSGSYILVLFALQSGISSYVIGLRQLSIAIGAFLGWSLLREKMTPTRVAGIACLLVGCILVAMRM